MTETPTTPAVSGLTVAGRAAAAAKQVVLLLVELAGIGTEGLKLLVHPAAKAAAYAVNRAAEAATYAADQLDEAVDSFKDGLRP